MAVRRLAVSVATTIWTVAGQPGWMPRGQRFRSKDELLVALRQWLRSSSAPTIGDTKLFRGRPWITIEIGSSRVKINADTTREAVRNIVGAVGGNPNKPWRVVANQNGRINKVVVTDSREPGWYAYLTDSLDREAVL